MIGRLPAKPAFSVLAAPYGTEESGFFLALIYHKRCLYWTEIADSE